MIKRLDEVHECLGGKFAKRFDKYENNDHYVITDYYYKSEINERRIPAIRKTQTEAEDHKKMQHKRGEPSACAKEEANQPEWRQGGEASLQKKKSSKQQRLFSRCALACNLGGRGAPF